MSSQPIIDSHIHLWPDNMSNEQGHAWMTPGMPLAKQHVLSDYYKASQQEAADPSSEHTAQGVVYVETDVRYDTPSHDLSSWTKGPLDEIKFLRAVVEGEYGERDSRMLQAIVAWAPMDQPTQVLEKWLRLAEETAGPETWKRFRGFRFLLQFIQDQNEFEKLVFGDAFIENLRLLGREGFSFDVGVDQHSGGTWQLEAVNKAMAKAHQGVPENEKVILVLNHLCKPDFRKDSEQFASWKTEIEKAARLSNTYMKLSGAFSELPDGLKKIEQIVDLIKPWVDHVLDCFGPSRVMFGSDWPVCNVNGPTGEQSWVSWREVVRLLLEKRSSKLSKEESQSIWRGTASEAYRLG